MESDAEAMASKKRQLQLQNPSSIDKTSMSNKRQKLLTTSKPETIPAENDYSGQDSQQIPSTPNVNELPSKQVTRLSSVGHTVHDSLVGSQENFPEIPNPSNPYSNTQGHVSNLTPIGPITPILPRLNPNLLEPAFQEQPHVYKYDQRSRNVRSISDSFEFPHNNYNQLSYNYAYFEKDQERLVKDLRNCELQLINLQSKYNITKNQLRSQKEDLERVIEAQRHEISELRTNFLKICDRNDDTRIECSRLMAENSMLRTMMNTSYNIPTGQSGQNLNGIAWPQASMIQNPEKMGSTSARKELFESPTDNVKDPYHINPNINTQLQHSINYVPVAHPSEPYSHPDPRIPSNPKDAIPRERPYTFPPQHIPNATGH